MMVNTEKRERIQLAASSVQPLYMQIKEVLKQRILDGEYAPHARLASESELMKQFGVSRITVRQALRDLHTEGLVFSVQGKGSFVSKPKAVQDIQRLLGFGEAMAAKGYETSTKVLRIQTCRAPKDVAAALELGSGAQVVEIKRIRYLNREPVSVDHSFFPVHIGESLFGRDLARDIFPMLENELGIPLDHADLRIEAVSADEELAALLNVEPASPLLRINRLVLSQDGTPVDFEYLSYRGDAYQYQLRVDRR
ncbi:GntR family transcriptional regulator [Thioalkalivibrio sulfidiphilus]|uniref:GntR family transcriptional regulator n=1 Tax=Thioalkalivibrio sulfidiphilus TaxID=1033854 RepID=UPI003B35BB55